jgi:predicted DCC family thiol-disulfide oxidoreductase YuxK
MSTEPAVSPPAPVAALHGASSDVTGPHAIGKRPVIFFDGVCGLCNAWIDFVVARDKTRVFRFGPLQGETAREWLNLPLDGGFDSVMLVDSTGIYHKSDAVWRILARLPGPWRLIAGLLRVIPRPIRNWGYAFVARHRYRWFGKKETCRLPNADERERFVP